MEGKPQIPSFLYLNQTIIKQALIIVIVIYNFFFSFSFFLETKYTGSLRDHTITMLHMQRELESLRASENSVRVKLRDIELDNDDLEKSEREKDSSLQDVEARYGKSLERIALLEEELVGKAQLEEELQRLKDELRGMFSPLSCPVSSLGSA